MWDVAVDIRRGSPHVRQDGPRSCSARKTSGISGFRKASPTGSSRLSERAVFTYLCTATYDAKADAGMRWDDPRLAIDWPVSDPQLCPTRTHARRCSQTSRKSACRSTQVEPMKILLLGGNGQVGHELRRSLAPLGEVVVTTRNGELPEGGACETLDLYAPETFAPLIDRIATGRGGQCHRAHRRGSRRGRARAGLPRQCRSTGRTGQALRAARGAALVHYSTDYVFDGSGTASVPRGRSDLRRWASMAPASSQASRASRPAARSI